MSTRWFMWLMRMLWRLVIVIAAGALVGCCVGFRADMQSSNWLAVTGRTILILVNLNTLRTTLPDARRWVRPR